ncbi:hypothetical protein BC781_11070 [Sediminitomix flava]|uniref:Uncharacterized protein n=1 Tax=Sediminitomix flava TaxID=379075 RepID=A0A315YYR5_SEDFL|nr:hypothetical protein BC781_11070 [Sediminitomix flava]
MYYFPHKAPFKSYKFTIVAFVISFLTVSITLISHPIKTTTEKTDTDLVIKNK